MRIGELLVEQRKLRQSELTRALADKPATKRLVSYLIEKGLVEFDEASRALGEQKRVPCALTKHLAGRDPSAAQLIPAELGRSSCALPIGKSSSGAVVVCVRDPAPALQAALERALGAPTTMVITPAAQLEALVLEAYGEAPHDEFDIDFSSSVEDNPIAAFNPLDTPTEPPQSRAASQPRAQTPPLPDMAALDPESVRLSLTDLDDERVDKDPSQSGQFAIPAIPRTRTSPPVMPAAEVPLLARAMSERAKPMPFETLETVLGEARTREAATDAVLSYVATRWTAGLVLAIRGKEAIGYRGHAVTAPESITIPLTYPSTVSRAIEAGAVSVHKPDGPTQQKLFRALAGPTNPAAVSINLGSDPVAVLAVGDPLAGASDLEPATADLTTLAEKLAAAYARIAGR